MSGRRILLIATDLMVGSRIEGLARAGGATVVRRSQADATGGPFDLVILDLQAGRDPLAEVVARLRAAEPGGPPPRIVAFGPHVATALLDAARAAGVDEVVSRGGLLGDFAAIVDRWCR